MKTSLKDTTRPVRGKDEEKRAENMAKMLKALAHPLRLRIVAILSQQPEHVTGLAARLETHQPLVSQQLGILRLSGLVESNRQGGYTYYRLTIPELKEFVRCIERCCRM